jgi:hypothetical protein
VRTEGVAHIFLMIKSLCQNQFRARNYACDLPLTKKLVPKKSSCRFVRAKALENKTEYLFEWQISIFVMLKLTIIWIQYKISEVLKMIFKNIEIFFGKNVQFSLFKGLKYDQKFKLMQTYVQRLTFVLVPTHKVNLVWKEKIILF